MNMLRLLAACMFLYFHLPDAVPRTQHVFRMAAISLQFCLLTDSMWQGISPDACLPHTVLVCLRGGNCDICWTIPICANASHVRGRK